MLELDSCVYTNHTPIPGQELVKDILFPTRFPLIGWIPRALLSYQGYSLLGINTKELTQYLDKHKDQAVIWIENRHYPNPVRVPSDYADRVLLGLEDPEDGMIYVGTKTLPEGSDIYDRIVNCCSERGLWMAPPSLLLDITNLSSKEIQRGRILYSLLKEGYDAIPGDSHNNLPVMGGSGVIQYYSNIHCS